MNMDDLNASCWGERNSSQNTRYCGTTGTKSSYEANSVETEGRLVVTKGLKEWGKERLVVSTVLILGVLEMVLK